ncbi:MAG: YeiH family putative sulfate export transporter [Gemmatimonadaceae bacterium]|nr:YeiH family putative sulfate export transporter [Gemmatimonadaceae bacterium]NUQ92275.1 YeiH family putative sulfate export transporter [Gemmatimonadaceae bacterium]NUR20735.1 YeiH family putative sulfate export transporter [Gemmatimonadaceae bacterium]NUS95804.1 YeiH family putative sulfate export transporter [Gemmatimonadaceae bacterium]
MYTSYPARRARELAPGVLLCVAVAAASFFIQRAEERLLGHAIIEALVVAIVLGMIVRTARALPARFAAGVSFSGKEVLEVAVLLLGASVDLPQLLRAGPALLAGIVLIVALGLTAGYWVGRMLGLAPKLAVLVACGNAICGNSAIAAVAPVIGADAKDVASAIAFTAVLGVVMVLGLPLLIEPLALSHYQYGVLAGMTVYAVPQVLAATFPVSALAGEVGTLVKLVRVLMLGPVVLFFTLRTRKGEGRRGSTSIGRLVPWFIVGFVVLAVLRSTGVLPASLATSVRFVSGLLMILAMAALGLGVDARAVARAGSRVSLTVTLSLITMLALSTAMILALRIK